MYVKCWEGLPNFSLHLLILPLDMRMDLSRLIEMRTEPTVDIIWYVFTISQSKVQLIISLSLCQNYQADVDLFRSCKEGIWPLVVYKC